VKRGYIRLKPAPPPKPGKPPSPGYEVNPSIENIESELPGIRNQNSRQTMGIENIESASLVGDFQNRTRIVV
jgi:hypothetical protein